MTLDPTDWTSLRNQGHTMLDDMFDHLQGRVAEPVWRPPTEASRAAFNAPLPSDPTDLAANHDVFRRQVLPYGGGNTHPGFMGWVQGGGTAVGMLADMLAAGLNANLGGRDHMAIAVEQQIVVWMRHVFDYPADATGLFLTGASQANFLAVLIARRRALGPEVRERGLGDDGGRLTAYASRTAHGCLPRAFDMAGLGSDCLRRVATDHRHRLDVDALRTEIRRDRDAGRKPFLLIGAAGSVDVGAIDDLNILADIAAEEDLTFHVDGALGALGMLSPDLAGRFAGIERSDSLAFDFHKWGQTPYDAGFLLVRDGGLHRSTFEAKESYLARYGRGLAAGDWWPCDYGPDLSRGFRALKTWFTLRTYGTKALGAAMAANCRLATDLAAKITDHPQLELMAPVALNIVCFGYGDGQHNARIVADLQEAGVVAPSLTMLDGRPAIRAAIVNHRTRPEDVDALVQGVLRLGDLAARPATEARRL
jgi:aromatic-L-amino-acid decarboxylase